jgi:hypothetical protein
MVRRNKALSSLLPSSAARLVMNQLTGAQQGKIGFAVRLVSRLVLTGTIQKGWLLGLAPITRVVEAATPVYRGASERLGVIPIENGAERV